MPETTDKVYFESAGQGHGSSYFPVGEVGDYALYWLNYYLKDEKGDEIYDLCREKLMAFISFWYFSQNASLEDFKSLEEEIETGAI